MRLPSPRTCFEPGANTMGGRFPREGGGGSGMVSTSGPWPGGYTSRASEHTANGWPWIVNGRNFHVFSASENAFDALSDVVSSSRVAVTPPVSSMQTLNHVNADWVIALASPGTGGVDSSSMVCATAGSI